MLGSNMEADILLNLSTDSAWPELTLVCDKLTSIMPSDDAYVSLSPSPEIMDASSLPIGAVMKELKVHFNERNFTS